MTNQNHLSPSELVLNQDGSVYHLALQPEQLAQTVIVVGDPERVSFVSAYFDSIEHRVQKREFVSHTGRLGAKRVSVVSSGIGTDNVEILLNELDALVNIDLVNRHVKSNHTSLKVIRIGTSGILHPTLPVDSFLASSYGLGLDTLMQFYAWQQSPESRIFCEEVQQLTGLGFCPYLAKKGDFWQDKFREGCYEGITLTCPGFYAPQGRVLRLALRQTNFLASLKDCHFEGLPISNLEMETAGYYALCQLLGHEMLSLNALIANRSTGQFSADPHATVIKLIEKVLDSL